MSKTDKFNFYIFPTLFGHFFKPPSSKSIKVSGLFEKMNWPGKIGLLTCNAAQHLYSKAKLRAPSRLYIDLDPPPRAPQPL